MNIHFIFGLSLLWCCTNGSGQYSDLNQSTTSPQIVCTDSACVGVYSGPEFIQGDDVAHQFSNKMATAVGDKLKELYHERKFAKVDLKNIIMTTKDMDGKGDVIYSLSISFVQVADSCQAFTAFDHRGGWGHTPKLENVLAHFSKAKGLEYQFKETPEGLTEYWLQWKLEQYQGECPR